MSFADAEPELCRDDMGVWFHLGQSSKPFCLSAYFSGAFCLQLGRRVMVVGQLCWQPQRGRWERERRPFPLFSPAISGLFVVCPLGPHATCGLAAFANGNAVVVFSMHITGCDYE